MEKKRKLNMPAWIFIAMFAGIAVGWSGALLGGGGFAAFTTQWIKPVGTIYVNLLKFLVVPVVILSIAEGVTALKDLKRVGSVGVKTFLYYLVTTAIAVSIGLITVSIFQGSFQPLPSAQLSGLNYQVKDAPSVMSVVVQIFPDNIIKPLLEMDMLPVIVLSLLLGAGVLAAGEEGAPVARLIHSGFEVCMKMMGMILRITPVGVFCLMCNIVAVNGIEVIGSLTLILGVAYLAFLLHCLLVYSVSVRFLVKMNSLHFFRGILPAMITGFTTTSSAASLPVSMNCVNKMGASPEISSFVLPLGATINMDGTAIYQAVCAVFIACCYGIQLTLGDMLTIVLTATLASIGSAGVSGAGMIMLAMTLSQVGIPVEGIALIAGMDKVFDMGRTCLNITGDMSCALFISRLEQKKR